MLYEVITKLCCDLLSKNCIFDIIDNPTFQKVFDLAVVICS